MKTLTQAFLVELLAVCIKNKSVYYAVSQHMKENFIPNDDIRTLWNYISKYYKVEQKSPTYGILKQRIETDNKKGKMDGVIDVLVDTRDMVEIDEEQILVDFQIFIKESKFVDLFQTVSDQWNLNKKEQAYKMFMTGAEDLAAFSIVDSKFIKLFGDFEDRMFDRLAGQYTQRMTFPFGIDGIDNLTGGATTGETELWLGDSGVGKSKGLVQRGITTARSGGVVLHVQAEGTEEQCVDNFDACWTGSNYNDVKVGRIEPNKIKALKKVIRKRGKGEIYIKTSDQFGSLDMGQIRNWVIELLKIGPLHHLVIDYLDLIQPAGDTKRFGFGAEGERLRQIEVARQFKNICVEFNLLGTTATQSSDIPSDLRNDPSWVITRNFLGNAKRKVEPFSYFFTINQTAEEKRNHVARVHVDKMREFPSEETYIIKQSLRNSRFYDRKSTIDYLDYLEQEKALKEMDD